MKSQRDSSMYHPKTFDFEESTKGSNTNSPLSSAAYSTSAISSSDSGYFSLGSYPPSRLSMVLGDISNSYIQNRVNIWSADFQSSKDSLVPQVECSRSKTQYLSFFNDESSEINFNHNSRFFVIKSFSTEDIHASILNGIWTSTKLGNRRLSKAFRGTGELAKIFLMYSENGSGKFCGFAEMKEDVDFNLESNIWSEKSRWKGIFKVKWHIVKNVPNKSFYSLKNPLNENKSVTNSRDTQEIPFDLGVKMLNIFETF